MRARPSVGARVVVRIDSVVVLPAPFGPSSAKNSPGRTSKLIPSTAFRSALRYRLTRFSTRIAGASAAARDCARGVVAASTVTGLPRGGLCRRRSYRSGLREQLL